DLYLNLTGIGFTKIKYSGFEDLLFDGLLGDGDILDILKQSAFSAVDELTPPPQNAEFMERNAFYLGRALSEAANAERYTDEQLQAGVAASVNMLMHNQDGVLIKVSSELIYSLISIFIDEGNQNFERYLGGVTAPTVSIGVTGDLNVKLNVALEPSRDFKQYYLRKYGTAYDANHSDAFVNVSFAIVGQGIYIGLEKEVKYYDSNGEPVSTIAPLISTAARRDYTEYNETKFYAEVNAQISASINPGEYSAAGLLEIVFDGFNYMGESNFAGFGGWDIFPETVNTEVVFADPEALKLDIHAAVGIDFGALLSGNYNTMVGGINAIIDIGVSIDNFKNNAEALEVYKIYFASSLIRLMLIDGNIYVQLNVFMNEPVTVFIGKDDILFNSVQLDLTKLLYDLLYTDFVPVVQNAEAQNAETILPPGAVKPGDADTNDGTNGGSVGDGYKNGVRRNLAQVINLDNSRTGTGIADFGSYLNVNSYGFALIVAAKTAANLLQVASSFINPASDTVDSDGDGFVDADENKDGIVDINDNPRNPLTNPNTFNMRLHGDVNGDGKLDYLNGDVNVVENLVNMFVTAVTLGAYFTDEYGFMLQVSAYRMGSDEYFGSFASGQSAAVVRTAAYAINIILLNDSVVSTTGSDYDAFYNYLRDDNKRVRKTFVKDEDSVYLPIINGNAAGYAVLTPADGRKPLNTNDVYEKIGEDYVLVTAAQLLNSPKIYYAKIDATEYSVLTRKYVYFSSLNVATGEEEYSVYEADGLTPAKSDIRLFKDAAFRLNDLNWQIHFAIDLIAGAEFAQTLLDMSALARTISPMFRDPAAELLAQVLSDIRGEVVIHLEIYLSLTDLGRFALDLMLELRPTDFNEDTDEPYFGFYFRGNPALVDGTESGEFIKYPAPEAYITIPGLTGTSGAEIPGIKIDSKVFTRLLHSNLENALDLVPVFNGLGTILGDLLGGLGLEDLGLGESPYAPYHPGYTVYDPYANENGGQYAEGEYYNETAETIRPIITLVTDILQALVFLRGQLLLSLAETSLQTIMTMFFPESDEYVEDIVLLGGSGITFDMIKNILRVDIGITDGVVLPDSAFNIPTDILYTGYGTSASLPNVGNAYLFSIDERVINYNETSATILPAIGGVETGFKAADLNERVNTYLNSSQYALTGELGGSTVAPLYLTNAGVDNLDVSVKVLTATAGNNIIVIVYNAKSETLVTTFIDDENLKTELDSNPSSVRNEIVAELARVYGQYGVLTRGKKTDDDAAVIAKIKAMDDVDIITEDGALARIFEYVAANQVGGTSYAVEEQIKETFIWNDVKTNTQVYVALFDLSYITDGLVHIPGAAGNSLGENAIIGQTSGSYAFIRELAEVLFMDNYRMRIRSSEEGYSAVYNNNPAVYGSDWTELDAAGAWKFLSDEISLEKHAVEFVRTYDDYSGGHDPNVSSAKKDIVVKIVSLGGGLIAIAVNEEKTAVSVNLGIGNLLLDLGRQTKILTDTIDKKYDKKLANFVSLNEFKWEFGVDVEISLKDAIGGFFDLSELTNALLGETFNNMFNVAIAPSEELNLKIGISLDVYLDFGDLKNLKFEIGISFGGVELIRAQYFADNGGADLIVADLNGLGFPKVALGGLNLIGLVTDLLGGIDLGSLFPAEEEAQNAEVSVGDYSGAASLLLLTISDSRVTLAITRAVITTIVAAIAGEDVADMIPELRDVEIGYAEDYLDKNEFVYFTKQNVVDGKDYHGLIAHYSNNTAAMFVLPDGYYIKAANGSLIPTTDLNDKSAFDLTRFGTFIYGAANFDAYVGTNSVEHGILPSMGFEKFLSTGNPIYGTLGSRTAASKVPLFNSNGDSVPESSTVFAYYVQYTKSATAFYNRYVERLQSDAGESDKSQWTVAGRETVGKTLAGLLIHLTDDTPYEQSFRLGINIERGRSNFGTNITSTIVAPVYSNGKYAGCDDISTLSKVGLALDLELKLRTRPATDDISPNDNGKSEQIELFEALIEGLLGMPDGSFDIAVQDSIMRYQLGLKVYTNLAKFGETTIELSLKYNDVPFLSIYYFASSNSVYLDVTNLGLFKARITGIDLAAILTELLTSALDENYDSEQGILLFKMLGLGEESGSEPQGAEAEYQGPQNISALLAQEDVPLLTVLLGNETIGISPNSQFLNVLLGGLGLDIELPPMYDIRIQTNLTYGLNNLNARVRLDSAGNALTIDVPRDGFKVALGTAAESTIFKTAGNAVDPAEYGGLTGIALNSLNDFSNIGDILDLNALINGLFDTLKLSNLGVYLDHRADFWYARDLRYATPVGASDHSTGYYPGYDAEFYQLASSTQFTNGIASNIPGYPIIEPNVDGYESSGWEKLADKFYPANSGGGTGYENYNRLNMQHLDLNTLLEVITPMSGVVGTIIDVVNVIFDIVIPMATFLSGNWIGNMVDPPAWFFYNNYINNESMGGIFLKQMLNPELSYVFSPHYVHGTYKRVRLRLDKDNQDALRIKVEEVTNIQGVSAEWLSGINDTRPETNGTVKTIEINGYDTLTANLNPNTEEGASTIAQMYERMQNVEAYIGDHAVMLLLKNALPVDLVGLLEIVLGDVLQSLMREITGIVGDILGVLSIEELISGALRGILDAVLPTLVDLLGGLLPGMLDPDGYLRVGKLVDDLIMPDKYNSLGEHTNITGIEITKLFLPEMFASPNDSPSGNVNNYTTVYGTVKYLSGVPVAGATVSYGDYEGTTDSSGNYMFINIPGGDYQVQVTAAGFEDLSTPLSPKKINLASAGSGKANNYTWESDNKTQSIFFVGEYKLGDAASSYIPASKINFVLEPKTISMFYDFTVSATFETKGNGTTIGTAPGTVESDLDSWLGAYTVYPDIAERALVGTAASHKIGDFQFGTQDNAADRTVGTFVFHPTKIQALEGRYHTLYFFTGIKNEILEVDLTIVGGGITTADAGDFIDGVPVSYYTGIGNPITLVGDFSGSGAQLRVIRITSGTLTGSLYEIEQLTTLGIATDDYSIVTAGLVNQGEIGVAAVAADLLVASKYSANVAKYFPVKITGFADPAIYKNEATGTYYFITSVENEYQYRKFVTEQLQPTGVLGASAQTKYENGVFFGISYGDNIDGTQTQDKEFYIEARRFVKEKKVIVAVKSAANNKIPVTEGVELWLETTMRGTYANGTGAIGAPGMAGLINAATANTSFFSFAEPYTIKGGDYQHGLTVRYEHTLLINGAMPGASEISSMTAANKQYLQDWYLLDTRPMSDFYMDSGKNGQIYPDKSMQFDGVYGLLKPGGAINALTGYDYTAALINSVIADTNAIAGDENNKNFNTQWVDVASYDPHQNQLLFGIESYNFGTGWHAQAKKNYAEAQLSNMFIPVWYGADGGTITSTNVPFMWTKASPYRPVLDSTSALLEESRWKDGSFDAMRAGLGSTDALNMIRAELYARASSSWDSGYNSSWDSSIPKNYFASYEYLSYNRDFDGYSGPYSDSLYYNKMYNPGLYGVYDGQDNLVGSRFEVNGLGKNAPYILKFRSEIYQNFNYDATLAKFEDTTENGYKYVNFSDGQMSLDVGSIRLIRKEAHWSDESEQEKENGSDSLIQKVRLRLGADNTDVVVTESSKTGDYSDVWEIPVGTGMEDYNEFGVDKSSIGTNYAGYAGEPVFIPFNEVTAGVGKGGTDTLDTQSYIEAWINPTFLSDLLGGLLSGAIGGFIGLQTATPDAKNDMQNLYVLGNTYRDYVGWGGNEAQHIGYALVKFDETTDDIFYDFKYDSYAQYRRDIEAAFAKMPAGMVAFAINMVKGIDTLKNFAGGYLDEVFATLLHDAANETLTEGGTLFGHILPIVLPYSWISEIGQPGNAVTNPYDLAPLTIKQDLGVNDVLSSAVLNFGTTSSTPRLGSLFSGDQESYLKDTEYKIVAPTTATATMRSSSSATESVDVYGLLQNTGVLFPGTAKSNAGATYLAGTNISVTEPTFANDSYDSLQSGYYRDVDYYDLATYAKISFNSNSESGAYNIIDRISLFLNGSTYYNVTNDANSKSNALSASFGGSGGWLANILGWNNIQFQPATHGGATYNTSQLNIAGSGANSGWVIDKYGLVRGEGGIYYDDRTRIYSDSPIALETHAYAWEELYQEYQHIFMMNYNLIWYEEADGTKIYASQYGNSYLAYADLWNSSGAVGAAGNVGQAARTIKIGNDEYTISGGSISGGTGGSSSVSALVRTYLAGQSNQSMQNDFPMYGDDGIKEITFDGKKFYVQYTGNLQANALQLRADTLVYDYDDANYGAVTVTDKNGDAVRGGKIRANINKWLAKNTVNSYFVIRDYEYYVDEISGLPTKRVKSEVWVRDVYGCYDDLNGNGLYDGNDCDDTAVELKNEYLTNDNSTAQDIAAAKNPQNGQLFEGAIANGKIVAIPVNATDDNFTQIQILNNGVGLKRVRTPLDGTSFFRAGTSNPGTWEGGTGSGQIYIHAIQTPPQTIVFHDPFNPGDFTVIGGSWAEALGMYDATGNYKHNIDDNGNYLVNYYTELLPNRYDALFVDGGNSVLGTGVQVYWDTSDITFEVRDEDYYCYITGYVANAIYTGVTDSKTGLTAVARIRVIMEGAHHDFVGARVNAYNPADYKLSPLDDDSKLGAYRLGAETDVKIETTTSPDDKGYTSESGFLTLADANTAQNSTAGIKYTIFSAFGPIDPVDFSQKTIEAYMRGSYADNGNYIPGYLDDLPGFFDFTYPIEYGSVAIDEATNTLIKSINGAQYFNGFTLYKRVVFNYIKWDYSFDDVVGNKLYLTATYGIKATAGSTNVYESHGYKLVDGVWIAGELKVPVIITDRTLASVEDLGKAWNVGNDFAPVGFTYLEPTGAETAGHIEVGAPVAVDAKGIPASIDALLSKVHKDLIGELTLANLIAYENQYVAAADRSDEMFVTVRFTDGREGQWKLVSLNINELINGTAEKPAYQWTNGAFPEYNVTFTFEDGLRRTFVVEGVVKLISHSLNTIEEWDGKTVTYTPFAYGGEDNSDEAVYSILGLPTVLSGFETSGNDSPVTLNYGADFEYEIPSFSFSGADFVNTAYNEETHRNERYAEYKINIKINTNEWKIVKTDNNGKFEVTLRVWQRNPVSIETVLLHPYADVSITTLNVRYAYAPGEYAYIPTKAYVERTTLFGIGQPLRDCLKGNYQELLVDSRFIYNIELENMPFDTRSQFYYDALIYDTVAGSKELEHNRLDVNKAEIISINIGDYEKDGVYGNEWIDLSSVEAQIASITEILKSEELTISVYKAASIVIPANGNGDYFKIGAPNGDTDNLIYGEDWWFVAEDGISKEDPIKGLMYNGTGRAVIAVIVTDKNGAYPQTVTVNLQRMKNGITVVPLNDQTIATINNPDFIKTMPDTADFVKYGDVFLYQIDPFDFVEADLHPALEVSYVRAPGAPIVTTTLTARMDISVSTDGFFKEGSAPGTLIFGNGNAEQRFDIVLVNVNRQSLAVSPDAITYVDAEKSGQTLTNVSNFKDNGANNADADIRYNALDAVVNGKPLGSLVYSMTAYSEFVLPEYAKVKFTDGALLNLKVYPLGVEEDGKFVAPTYTEAGAELAIHVLLGDPNGELNLGKGFAGFVTDIIYVKVLPETLVTVTGVTIPMDRVISGLIPFAPFASQFGDIVAASITATSNLGRTYHFETDDAVTYPDLEGYNYNETYNTQRVSGEFLIGNGKMIAFGRPGKEVYSDVSARKSYNCDFVIEGLYPTGVKGKTTETVFTQATSYDRFSETTDEEAIVTFNNAMTLTDIEVLSYAEMLEEIELYNALPEYEKEIYRLNFITLDYSDVNYPSTGGIFVLHVTLYYSCADLTIRSYVFDVNATVRPSVLSEIRLDANKVGVIDSAVANTFNSLVPGFNIEVDPVTGKILRFTMDPLLGGLELLNDGTVNEFVTKGIAIVNDEEKNIEILWDYSRAIGPINRAGLDGGTFGIAQNAAMVATVYRTDTTGRKIILQSKEYTIEVASRRIYKLEGVSARNGTIELYNGESTPVAAAQDMLVVIPDLEHPDALVKYEPQAEYAANPYKGRDYDGSGIYGGFIEGSGIYGDANFYLYETLKVYYGMGTDDYYTVTLSQQAYNFRLDMYSVNQPYLGGKITVTMDFSLGGATAVDAAKVEQMTVIIDVAKMKYEINGGIADKEIDVYGLTPLGLPQTLRELVNDEHRDDLTASDGTIPLVDVHYAPAPNTWNNVYQIFGVVAGKAVEVYYSTDTDNGGVRCYRDAQNVIVPDVFIIPQTMTNGKYYGFNALTEASRVFEPSELALLGVTSGRIVGLVQAINADTGYSEYKAVKVAAALGEYLDTEKRQILTTAISQFVGAFNSEFSSSVTTTPAQRLSFITRNNEAKVLTTLLDIGAGDLATIVTNYAASLPEASQSRFNTILSTGFLDFAAVQALIKTYAAVENVYLVSEAPDYAADGVTAILYGAKTLKGATRTGFTVAEFESMRIADVWTGNQPTVAVRYDFRFATPKNFSFTETERSYGIQVSFGNAYGGIQIISLKVKYYNYYFDNAANGFVNNKNTGNQVNVSLFNMDSEDAANFGYFEQSLERVNGMGAAVKALGFVFDPFLPYPEALPAANPSDSGFTKVVGSESVTMAFSEFISLTWDDSQVKHYLRYSGTDGTIVSENAGIKAYVAPVNRNYYSGSLVVNPAYDDYYAAFTQTVKYPFKVLNRTVVGSEASSFFDTGLLKKNPIDAGRISPYDYMNKVDLTKAIIEDYFKAIGTSFKVTFAEGLPIVFEYARAANKAKFVTPNFAPGVD
ncbi:MAG: carboxypeptidase-like regulatory domain-containing protein, partial [Christensenellaceae bacterium]|nr:carboxypeptidase-like regulatory domain-containing protein [Christensenellaceae bacterium]